MQDVVIVLSGPEPPRVLGFVAAVQRRRIFVNAARVGRVRTDRQSASGPAPSTCARSGSGRASSWPSADLFGKRVGDDFLTDLAIEPSTADGSWSVVSAALGTPRSAAPPPFAPHRALGRGGVRRSSPARSSRWSPSCARCTRATSPHACRPLSPARRQQLAGLLEDDRLADLIEELPEDEAIRIIESLDVERAAHVIEEMEPDDAADLLGDLPEDERAALLAAMMPEESTPLRRLLAYDENTAGGLMTPEPLILPATATVAEALAVARAAEMPAELAAQVFVVRPADVHTDGNLPRRSRLPTPAAGGAGHVARALRRRR